MGVALNRLREQATAQLEELRSAFLTTGQLAERTSELRDACRATRDARLSQPASGG
jgi:hypothetical protein